MERQADARDTLRILPMNSGGTRSALGPDGVVAAPERREHFAI